MNEKLPNFRQSLYGYDLGRLRILAELWGIELDVPNVQEGLIQLEAIIYKKDRFEKVFNSLPDKALDALNELISNGGKMVWSQFTRKFGELREMGPAKRDRLKPYKDELTSPTETLWYRGLVAKAFFDSDDGTLEFAYIPEEFLMLIPYSEKEVQQSTIKLATTNELGVSLLADDSIVDDACTYLSGVRAGLSPDEMVSSMKLFDDARLPYHLTFDSLLALLISSKLMKNDRELNLDEVRKFLESERVDAYIYLINAWRRSDLFNELKLMPGLVFEGEWKNNPKKTRKAMLERLLTILHEYPPSNESNPYWSLQTFVEEIRSLEPDFQRTGGEYDAWYIRRENSDENLKGFSYWNEVEGELIKFFVAGVMYWLGLVDIALAKNPQSGEEIKATAFRFSKYGINYFLERLNGSPQNIDGEIHIRSNAQVHVHEHVPLRQRYQIARFCEWEGYRDNIYRFRITTKSLQRAQSQGLSPNQLLLLLKRYSVSVPSSLERAIRRWESSGTQTYINNFIVLRVRNAQILKALQGTSAARFLGEPLGSNAVIVKRNAWQKVQEALAELGYLSEVEFGISKTEE